MIFTISFKTNPLRYPFDTQSCVMVFQCEGNSGEFVQLVPQHLEYLGPKDLTQYFIRSKEMIDSLFVLLQANQHQPGYGRKH